MKLKKSFFLLAAISFVVSCGWEIPESVSVKTNAEYNFIIGERTQSLSEYLSVDTLKDSIGTASEDFSFDIYDYYPTKDKAVDYPSQKFLMDFSLYEIPIDIGEYLDKMDFAESLKNMSFEQTFDVPPLTVDEFKQPLKLPDLNEEIRTQTNMEFELVKIPQGINGKLPEDKCPSQTIYVKAPEFETIEFCSGELLLTLVCQDTPVTVTDLTVYLNDKNGKPITSGFVENLDSDQPIRLSLKGKTLYNELKMTVSGSSSGGTIGNFSTYSVSAQISNEAKISKATGLSMEIDPVTVNQEVIIETDDAFVECEIGDKSADEKSVLSIETKLPDGWSGITTTSKEIRLEGALPAADSEFDTTGETDPKYLLNRKLYLNGKTYSKGNIQVRGTLDIELKDATVVMPNGEIPSIEVSTSCDITKVDSMTVDLSQYESPIETEISENEDLPSEVTDVIEEIQLLPSGMSIEYYNTLPAGNNIQFTVNSTFFGITNSVKNMEGGTSAENRNTMEFKGENKLVNPSTDSKDSKIDFTAQMEFPGKTEEHPSYVTLTNIEIGESYTVGATVTPVFDWEYVTLKTDKTDVKGDVDTGLNVSEIFNGLTEQIGDDEFIDRIGLTNIPLYVYAVVPRAAEDAEDKINFEFTGTMKAVAYDENDRPIEDNAVTIAEDKINSEFTPLQFDAEDKDKQQVISFGESSVKEPADIADLFNSRNAKNIRIEYNFTLGSKNQGEAGSTVKIFKSDLDELEGVDSVSIKLHARMVLPLELKIMPAADGSSEAVKIDVMNLVDSEDDKSGDDLFGRDEATELDDIKKYIDAIEYVGIQYKMDNKILRYTNNQSIRLFFDMKDESGTSVYSDTISLSTSSSNRESFKIKTAEVEKLLETYPVHSDIYVELPVGNLIIPRETKVGMNLALCIKTNGTIELFSL